MNHKRKKRRNIRAGCKMFKFWKVNGFSKNNPEFEKHSDHVRRQFANSEVNNGDQ